VTVISRFSYRNPRTPRHPRTKQTRQTGATNNRHTNVKMDQSGAVVESLPNNPISGSLVTAI
jgi:hypothetical protein